MNRQDFITNRQCFYLIIFEVFGVLTLFLPGFLCRKLSQDAPLGLTFGFLAAGLFAWLLNVFYKKNNENLFSADKNRKLLFDAVIFLFFIQTVLLAAFALNITWEIVQMFLLPQLNKFFILFPFFLVSVFAAEKGMLPRAKMAEFCGKIFVFVFIFILFFSLKNIDLNQYEAIFLSPGKDVVIGSYDVFIIMETLIFSLCVINFSNEKQKYGIVLKKSVLSGYVIALVLLLILIGTFGVDYVGKMEYPAIRLLRNLTGSSSFLSRLDVLMIWIWIVSLFFFFCGSINYAHFLLNSVLEESSGKYMNYVLYIVIFVLAWLFGNVTDSYYVYRNYMFYIGTPLTILLLLVSIIWTCKKSENKESVGKRSEE